ncbi:hypothetical protein [Mesorhizobium sp. IMUNJ 23232]|uniref:hypothetical protein n=1 Tax=Mesorhizobium sp. IMUNJ 23232 TaxID=3376064 RepID=UPI00378919CD
MADSFDTDLAGLACRLEGVRVLREHHLWAAASALPLAVGRGSSGRASRRFAELMAADALLEAVLLLIDLAEPKRSVRGMKCRHGLWICVVDRQPGKAGDRFTAEHTDLAAALLMAFVRSFAPAGRRPAAVQHNHQLEPRTS